MRTKQIKRNAVTVGLCLAATIVFVCLAIITFTFTPFYKNQKEQYWSNVENIIGRTGQRIENFSNGKDSAWGDDEKQVLSCFFLTVYDEKKIGQDLKTINKLLETNTILTITPEQSDEFLYLSRLYTDVIYRYGKKTKLF